ncbi:hypothetical protein I6M90_13635 [Acinetobacter bereziniae]|uniref:hypothetical protein n=1 Tax=Acinetobacter bereziniae TaxID=106648 RepID=UPI0018FFE19B|nr:hypothetical protein [Acinetobacter bereziniae]MBJ8452986.1 hypothetical protein [Acinetobacter bereziniae]MBJ8457099.1 hypothetical protein [Acinetobacter bereziniae]
MNTKPNSINPIVTHRVQPMGFFKVAAISGLVTVGAVGLTYDQKATEYKPPVSIPNVTPSTYTVDALTITPETSGKAVIKLDSFLVLVSFDFESHPDSYGVPGSEFTAVDITNLAVEKITDVNGNDWNDFTDYNDHRNINHMIVGYIERNKLVEAN